MKLFEAPNETIKELLLTINVCLTTDTWTSPNDVPFVVIATHCIENEGRLRRKIHSFVIVPVKANGENLVDMVIIIILNWSFQNFRKISIDNYSSNDVVARTFIDHYNPRGLLLFHGKHLRIFYRADVLNVVVQDGLDEIKDSIRRVQNAKAQ